MRDLGGSRDLPVYTVAKLPTKRNLGAHAYASDGRAFVFTATTALSGAVTYTVTLEAAGAGTGTAVQWNGAAWKIAGTTSTVAA